MKEVLKHVPVEKIKFGDRTRVEYGRMEELIESIKEKGILQPITISSDYTLLAGGRRLTAAKAAGLKEIPCLIRSTKEDAKLDALEVELIENAFREDFTFQERAAHIKKLHDYCTSQQMDWSLRKTAQLLNRDKMGVHRDLQVAAAIEKIPELANAKTQDEVLKPLKKMSERAAVDELARRQATRIDMEPDDRKSMFLKIATHNYRVGDFFAASKDFATGGMIHFIELDPPYAIDLNQVKGGAGQRAETKTTSGKAVTDLAKNYNEIRREDYPGWFGRMAKETYRVANRDAWMICWFGPTHFTMVKEALIAAKWQVNDIPGIWVKPGGQTAAPEYNLASAYEPFFICRKGQPVLVKRGRSNVFDYTPTAGQKKYHPTERPLALMQELLATFCIPSQVVLVPCLGSGVTLRACYLHGMKGLGFDLSDQYKKDFLLAVEQDMELMEQEEE